jgi:hypothetical protein
MSAVTASIIVPGGIKLCLVSIFGKAPDSGGVTQSIQIYNLNHIFVRPRWGQDHTSPLFSKHSMHSLMSVVVVYIIVPGGIKLCLVSIFGKVTDSGGVTQYREILYLVQYLCTTSLVSGTHFTFIFQAKYEFYEVSGHSICY